MKDLFVRVLPVVLLDVVGLAGVGLTSYGFWLVGEPYGFMCAGVLLLGGALIIGARRGAS